MATKNFTAQVDDWIRKSERRAEVIVQQSAHDVFEQASRTKPSTIRGGSVLPGFVPRDTGFLAASAIFSLNDIPGAKGEGAYELGLAGMRVGDTAALAWTAVYARAQHYKGWLWVDTAAANWQEIVRQNVARAKAQVR